MRRILCYGDSNTWGSTPGSGRRYPDSVRWTGVMAAELGEDYQVVEAGLNGRTTVYPDPFKPILNGLAYLPMMLVQSKPLDLVILSLGTNDLKFTTALGAAKGAGKLVETCLAANAALIGKTPVFESETRVLVVSPIALDPCAFERDPYCIFRKDAPQESLKFPALFRHYADANHVEYFDAATVAKPSRVDGIHMDPESHLALGKALAKKVQEIL